MTTMTNGVDPTALFATINAVRAQPKPADFRFRVSNRWVSGTHNRAVISGFYAAGQEHRHEHETVLDSDHPAVLVGTDQGPTPAEYLLHALGACLMSGLGNVAAARGIQLDEVMATVEGDIDLRGILGLDPTVRNGFQGDRVTFHVKGAAEADKLAALIHQSQRRSAVYDALTNGVPVTIDVAAGEHQHRVGRSVAVGRPGAAPSDVLNLEDHAADATRLGEVVHVLRGLLPDLGAKRLLHGGRVVPVERSHEVHSITAHRLRVAPHRVSQEAG
jgi:uncharacterized OsmC-like protein